MDAVGRHRDAAAAIAALVLPLCFAAVMVPFRSNFASSAAALVLVAVVVGVAVLGNRFAGWLSTVSAALWFDFFLTRPYERFAITHRPDIETAVSLFVVGIVVTELAARNRIHHQAANEESDYVGLLYDMSELVTSGAPPHEVLDRARGELMVLLRLRGCRFDAGTPIAPSMRIEHDGHVLLGGRVWRVDELGLPGPELELLVQTRGRIIGRFVLNPTPGLPVSLQRRVVAVTVADQVAAALTPQLRSA